jgi:hypothetical protein
MNKNKNQTAAQLLQARRDAGLTAADIEKDYGVSDSDTQARLPLLTSEPFSATTEEV